MIHLPKAHLVPLIYGLYFMLSFDPISHSNGCYCLQLQGYIEKLVREAYAIWQNLEEFDGVLNDNIALLTQGMSN